MTKSSKLMGFLIVTLLLFLGLVSQKAFADSRLIIVKYGLSPGATGFSENQTTNDGLQINNLPLDNLGNELSVLSGIHYLVYEISPTGDGSELKATNPPPSSYTVLKEVADLATDSNGVASLSVSDGYYLIEEQTNPQKGLLKAALPLVIKAPVSGLNEVYIILNLVLIRKKPDLQTNLSLLLNQLKFLKLLKVRMIHQKKFLDYYQKLV